MGVRTDHVQAVSEGILAQRDRAVEGVCFSFGHLGTPHMRDRIRLFQNRIRAPTKFSCKTRPNSVFPHLFVLSMSKFVHFSYFERLNVILDPNYLPDDQVLRAACVFDGVMSTCSFQDILRSRVATTGIVESNFEMQDTTFRFVVNR